MLKPEDIELLIKKVAAEFNLEFFYQPEDQTEEDSQIVLENLERSESMTSFAINRFIESFNKLAQEVSGPVNIVLTEDNRVENNE